MIATMDEKRPRKERFAKVRLSKNYTGHMATLLRKKKEEFQKKFRESLDKVI